MAFYIILWAVVGFWGVQYYFTHKIPSKYLYIFLAVALSCIVGARDSSVGADTLNYIDFYNTGVAQDNMTGVYEPMFMLLRYICYWGGFNHFFFLFVISLFSLFVWYYVSIKIKLNNYYLAFFIYFSMVFISYQINTVRTGIMASVVWLAFAFKINGEHKKALITMIVAVGFHLSALIFIPVLYFMKKKISNKVVLVLIVLGLVSILTQVGTILVGYFPFLTEIDRLAGYLSTDENVYGLTLGTTVNICLFLFVYFYYNKSYDESIGFRSIVNIMLLALFVICVFNPFHTIVTRVGQVLNLSLMFVWPFLLGKIRIKPLQILIVLLLCAYLWLYYSKAVNATTWNGATPYLPYTWSFNGIFR